MEGLFAFVEGTERAVCKTQGSSAVSPEVTKKQASRERARASLCWGVRLCLGREALTFQLQLPKAEGSGLG